MKNFLISVMAVFLLALFACGNSSQDHHNADQQKDQTESKEGASHGEGMEYTSAYICPMHCEGSGSEAPGSCPVCGMDYVERSAHIKDGHDH